MKKMPKLKPCPFCGKKPLLKSDIRYPRPACEAVTAYKVVCQNMSCIIYNADNCYFFTPKEAADAWNRRAADTPQLHTSLYDTVERHTDCTVEILKNLITGEISVGWYRNDKPPVGMSERGEETR